MNGIYVEATISGGFWSDTKDPIYLGVYGKNGGREFALQVDGESPFTNDGATVKLILGQACCNKTGIQVDNSTGLNANSPSLNPMNLNDIEYVYFRKYEGETNSTDDWAEFSKITVLFCDSSENLLRFNKSGRIHFARETGLQHWLSKIDPPKCQIKMILNKIVHEDVATNPAGFEWDLKWLGIVGGVDAQWAILPHYDTSGWSDPDDWEVSPNSSLTFNVDGCCGVHPVAILCQSIERDWPSAEDIGTSSIGFNVDCSNPGTIQQQVATFINGQSSNRKSKITYYFSIQTSCLD
jgi:hypothetical protein